jgi:hypothetical protein
MLRISRVLWVVGSLAIAWVAAAGPAPAKPAPPVAAKAAAAQPTTLAIVYPGWELWIGNDDVMPADDPSRYPGALKAVVAAFDKVDLAKALPAGSQATLISYADKVKVRVPLGPVDKLRGEAFGTQKDYVMALGNELVLAVSEAIGQLEKAPAGKRALIILSDGGDTNAAKAKPALAALKARAKAAGITVTSILYKSAISTEGDVLTTLVGKSIVANTAAALADQLAQALARLGS